MSERKPPRGTTPVRLDIIAVLPERRRTCRGCETMARAANMGLDAEDRGEAGYPPEWKSRFDALAALMTQIGERFGEKVIVRLWDPRTPFGLWFSLRHGAFRYPAFVVEGRKVPGSGDKILGDVMPRIARML